MKKKLIAGAIAGGLLLGSIIPAFAAKLPKVELCHITQTWDVPQNQWTTAIGHRINVSENALSAHQAHGDFSSTEGDNHDIDFPLAVFGGLTWGEVATNNGLNVNGGVNCAGFILDL